MRWPDKGRKPVYKWALLGILLSCALVLGVAEHALPPIVSLPGVRLGLPNAAIMLALYLFPFPETLILTALKCVLTALLTGSLPSLLHSLSGSLLSLCVMYPMARLARGRIGPVGVSVTGAICHNMGQLLCASLLMQTFLFPYLPVLIVSGALAGTAVGWATALLLPRFLAWRKPEGH